MKKLRTCVFPCAGFGTRFLPATKVIPKEMLPLVDKPIIQYGFEEALGSGLNKLIVITSKGKDSILDHFDHSTELEQALLGKGKRQMLDEVEKISRLIDIISVRQKVPLGLGHAVLMARDAVGDESFAVVLPDDVILADPYCLAQMFEVYRDTGGKPVLALMEVPLEETFRYGIVEKPSGNPPSNLAIIGRYILPPEIFGILEKTTTGAGGEIQLTDALRALMDAGEFYGLVFQGRRYDAGEKLGYLKATVDYALRDPVLGEEFRAYLRSLDKEIDG